MDDAKELTRRALAAYFRTARPDGDHTKLPNYTPIAEELNGKRYIIIRGNNHILAIYRVRNDGMLKRLRRWPKPFATQHP